jgi:protein TonB
MKIAGAIAAVFILIGVLGYVHQHKLASPSPAPAAPSSSAAPPPALSKATDENAPATDQQGLHISSAVAEGMVIYHPAPEYPQMARIAHISGDVLLKVTIDRTGRVTNVVAMQGHPILIQSAINAVKQWKYRPYVFNGEPVEVECTVKVKYHM